jgi:hypothetical protein
MPSDPTLRWPSEDCVQFAEKHKEDLFFGRGQTIRAVNSWIKNGKVVVEVGAFKDDDSSYIPRICVIGGGTIQIVSILESGAWR